MVRLVHEHLALYEMVDSDGKEIRICDQGGTWNYLSASPLDRDYLPGFNAWGAAWWWIGAITIALTVFYWLVIWIWINLAEKHAAITEQEPLPPVRPWAHR